MDSRVSEHFGRAPFHVVIDLETMESRSLRKEGECHDGNHGHCMPVDLLLANDVNLVVCKGIGRGAFARLAASNIDVFAAHDDTVGAVIVEYRKCRGKGMGQPQICEGHHQH